MAYSVKYRFNFDSDQGSAFRIDVLKDGYGHTSPILMRHIGGSPVIRREKSGCICGTSLEFPAECAVDGEFEEFKTSVPFTFKVNVYGGTNYGTLIWTGYVTPELMEAPDIAPPYDVQVCCTDGLGELKYTDFPARGGQTLWNHLTYLLGLTGLSLSVTVVNDITHGSVAASRFLHETAVSLDNLAGETCYDVLQAILTSIHATITQADGKWLIFRETGADVDTSTPSIDNAYVDGSTTASPIPVQEYGSAGSHARWPVGHMTHGNVPPRKGMVLTTDNNYFPNILSDAVWQAVANGVNAGSYWQFPAAGDGMKNMGVSFNEAIRQKLLLTIKVRNVGSGTDAGKLSVKVKAVGTAYSGSMTYYLANGTYGRRNPTTNFTWVNDEQDSVIEVQAPESLDTDNDYVEIGIVIPAYRNSAYDYFYLSSLDLIISNSDGTYEQRVYGVTLEKYEQFAGFRKEISLNNGARGKGDDISLSFSPVAGANDYVGVQELQYGVLFEPVGGDSIPTLKSDTFTTAMDYLSLMARDYALSIAGARTYVRGALNVPVGTALIPVAFKDTYDGKVYFVDTLSWDLYQDEMTVEMTSVPATSITVDGEVDEDGVPSNATGHQQSQVSSDLGRITITDDDYIHLTDGYTIDWFIPVTVNGSQTLRLNPVYAGLWADGWVSAGGIGSGGGGGGASYLKELLDIYHDSSGILRANGNSVSDGDVLVYDATNTRWVAAENNGGYTLPKASASVLGGVMVGSGLSIDNDGVLSASGSTFNGGEITQDLWLHTGGYTFGSTLYFGDRHGTDGYAYIKEDSDDHLTIYALSGITLSVGSNASVSIPSLSVALGGLSDVTISSETTGQVLYYGSGGWVNAALDIDDIGMPSRITGSGYLYYTSGSGWSLASGGGGGGGGGISTVTLASGTNNGTLKLTVDGVSTDNIAVKGLAALAYKATLAFSELTSSPTTLGGYGITDAKIVNGTITLGSETLTPLTSVSFGNLTSHPTTLIGYGITDAKIVDGTITLGSNYITPLTSVSLASGTNNGTLKLTVDGTSADNIAVKGLAALAYKASLAFSELTSSPTTLGGYGITDAKIVNGTITLGSETLTPLTSVSFSSLTSHPTTLIGYGITDAKIVDGTITLGSNYITPLTSHQTIYSLTLSAGSFTAGTYNPTTSTGNSVNIPTTLDHISDGSTRKLSDYVTLSTTQTIIGSKTFSVAVTASGGIVAGDDIYPGTTLDADLGLSNKRWGKLWAKDADLSGDLTMASTKHIDLGPVRISYDSNENALHITSNDGSTVNLYCDGYITAGA